MCQKNADRLLTDLPVSAFFIGSHKQKNRSRNLWSGEIQSHKRMLRKKCEALLGKGSCRLRTNMFVRERLLPFLKSRPMDAFRNILFISFTDPTTANNRFPVLLFLPQERTRKPEFGGMRLHVFLEHISRAKKAPCNTPLPSPVPSSCRVAI